MNFIRVMGLVFGLFLNNPGYGFISIYPENTMSELGTEITLACTTDTTYSSISWQFDSVGTHGYSDPTTIVSGCTVEPGFDPSYQVSSSDDGRCDLMIWNLNPDRVGVYTCNDTTSSRSAMVGTVDIDTLFYSSDPTGDAHVIFSCGISFFAYNKVFPYFSYPQPDWYPTSNVINTSVIPVLATGTLPWQAVSTITVEIIDCRIPSETCTIRYSQPVNLPEGMATNTPYYQLTRTIEQRIDGRCNSTISIPPANVMVELGTEATLTCTTVSDRSSIVWEFDASMRHNFFYVPVVIASGCVVEPAYRGTYGISGTGGQCNLVIPSVTADHVGVYTCHDSFDSRRAMLGTVDAPTFQCLSNITDYHDTSIEFICGVSFFDCNWIFPFFTYPQLSWYPSSNTTDVNTSIILVGGYNNLPFYARSSITTQILHGQIPRMTCTITYTMPMNPPQGMATNIPSFSLSRACISENQACDSGKWSDNCSLACNCLPTSCDRINGCTSCLNSGLTGSNCDEDIDECRGTSTACGTRGTCINTIGSYLCSCRPWYHWNGSDCYYISTEGPVFINMSRTRGFVSGGDMPVTFLAADLKNTIPDRIWLIPNDSSFGSLLFLVIPNSYSQPNYVSMKSPSAPSPNYTKPTFLVTFEFKDFNMSTEFNYRFLDDPRIIDLQPRVMLTTGGIRLTVIGSGFDNVASAKMLVTASVVFNNPLSATNVSSWQSCSIRNATMMICLTPNLEHLHTNQASSSRRRRRSVSNAHEPLFRRSAVSPSSNDDITVQLYLGFFLDDFPSYHNISEELPSLSMQLSAVGPEFQNSHDIIEYTPSLVGTLKLVGTNLELGCSIDDYTVFLGNKTCLVTNLSNSLLEFKPPAEEPVTNRFTHDSCSKWSGSYALVVRIGAFDVPSATHFIYCLKYINGSNTMASGGDTRYTAVAVGVGVGVGVPIILILIVVGVAIAIRRWRKRDSSVHNNADNITRKSYMKEGENKKSAMKVFPFNINNTESFEEENVVVKDTPVDSSLIPLAGNEAECYSEFTFKLKNETCSNQICLNGSSPNSMGCNKTHSNLIGSNETSSNPIGSNETSSNPIGSNETSSRPISSEHCDLPKSNFVSPERKSIWPSSHDHSLEPLAAEDTSEQKEEANGSTSGRTTIYPMSKKIDSTIPS